MLPDLSPSKVSKSASVSFFSALMPRPSTALRNSFLLIMPLPSSSNTLRRSRTWTAFDESTPKSCSATLLVGSGFQSSLPRSSAPRRDAPLAVGAASARFLSARDVGRNFLMIAASSLYEIAPLLSASMSPKTMSISASFAKKSKPSALTARRNSVLLTWPDLSSSHALNRSTSRCVERWSASHSV